MAYKPHLAGSLTFTTSSDKRESLPRTGSEGGDKGWPLRQNVPMRKVFSSKGCLLPRPVGWIHLSPLPSPASGRGSKTRRSDAPLFEPSLHRKPPSATINCPPDGPCGMKMRHKAHGICAFALECPRTTGQAKGSAFQVLRMGREQKRCSCAEKPLRRPGARESLRRRLRTSRAPAQTRRGRRSRGRALPAPGGAGKTR